MTSIQLFHGIAFKNLVTIGSGFTKFWEFAILNLYFSLIPSSSPYPVARLHCHLRTDLLNTLCYCCTLTAPKITMSIFLFSQVSRLLFVGSPISFSVYVPDSAAIVTASIILYSRRLSIHILQIVEYLYPLIRNHVPCLFQRMSVGISRHDHLTCDCPPSGPLTNRLYC